MVTYKPSNRESLMSQQAAPLPRHRKNSACALAQNSLKGLEPVQMTWLQPSWDGSCDMRVSTCLFNEQWVSLTHLESCFWRSGCHYTHSKSGLCTPSSERRPAMWTLSLSTCFLALELKALNQTDSHFLEKNRKLHLISHQGDPDENGKELFVRINRVIWTQLSPLF